VDPQLAEYLKNERFEGNIRQLEHTVRRMLLDKASGTSLDLADWLAQHIPEAGSVAAGDTPEQAAELLWPAIRSGQTTLSSAFAAVERKLLQSALHQADKTRREVAAGLGISERTLYEKLRQHGLVNGRSLDSAKKRIDTAECRGERKSRVV
jgi:DNA-binding NtrC family response regulator